MAKLTRRVLMQTSIGAAAVGMLAGVITVAPRVAAIAAPADTKAKQTPANSSGPTMLYIRNAATGEVGILSGEREIIVRDSDLVSRILNATR